jgi:4-amino-4-deoxy-L-arabinose transferase-like glycosyltransferase
MRNKLRAVKDYWPYLVLLILVIWGFSLRWYHIDYPSIGYHNMKENIYLMQAYHMYEGGGLFKLSMFHFGDHPNTYQKDMLPLIAWFIVLSWKLFGINLFWPRFLMVICSVANIVLIYWFMLLVSKRREFALASSVLMTFMPLGVFFGRNIQPDIPGVTFMLLYSIFLYKWIIEPKRSYFIWFTVFLAISVHLKLTNMVGLIPFLFMIPYRRIFSHIKKLIPEAAMVAGALATVYIWKYAQEIIMPNAANTAYDSIFSEIFMGYHASYWAEHRMILWYFVRDNFTAWYFWFALFGIVLAALKYRTAIGKYVLGSVLALIAYFTVVPGYLYRHTYYQAPFLPLVVLASAYLFFVVGSLAGDLITWLMGKKREELIRNSTVGILLLLVVIITWPSVRASIDRQFDTQFIGTDVAGLYLNTHAASDEKVFMGIDPSGQTVATLFYAERYGQWMPENLTEFKRWEQEKNFRWIFLYGLQDQTGHRNALITTSLLEQQQPELWNYINSTYRIRQVGLVKTNQGGVPYYFILGKGGSFDLAASLKAPVVAAGDYELTTVKIPFFTIAQD